MSYSANAMTMTRVVPLSLLLIVFCGCSKPVSREKEAAAIFTRANAVWAETTKTSKEWTTEYANAFGPESRAKFPANRAALRTSADKIVKILDEEARLTSDAIPLYEQAIALVNNEQHVKGMKLLVSSLRKDMESNEFVRSQMRLVSDESILDAKTFEQRFVGLGAQFGKARAESQREFTEGKRILGIE